MEPTCFCSLFIFNPAPYHAPVAVTAAIEPVQTMRLIVCCEAMVFALQSSRNKRLLFPVAAL